MGMTLKGRNKSLVYCTHYFEQAPCYFDSFIEAGVEANAKKCDMEQVCYGWLSGVPKGHSVSRMSKP